VNGAVAYYAAESGLEEGFLRYRYSRDAEVPFSSTMGDNKIYRSNLSQNKLVKTDGTTENSPTTGYAPSTGVPNTNDQFYDLRVEYLGTFANPFYGHNASNADAPTYLGNADPFSANYGTADYSFINVNKDDSIKIDLNNIDLVNNPLMLTLLFKGVDTNTGNRLKECQATAEVKFVVTDTTGTHEYKDLTSFNPSTCAGPLGTSSSNLINADAQFSGGGYAPPGAGFVDNQTGINYYYHMTNIYNNMLSQSGRAPDPYSASQKVTMYIKPLYHDVKIGLVTNACNSSATSAFCNRQAIVAGPYSSIYTTGYYGGVAKKLQANIDRQSGTLYDLFDYVIYKNS
jgi:hypothetical protein